MNNSGKNTGTPTSSTPRYRQIIIAMIAVLLVTLVFLLGFLYSKYRLLNKEEVDEEVVTNPHITEEDQEKMKGYTTFAIFGIDARDNQQLGEGSRSDVIMICNINNETSEIRLVSVYRDTYLDGSGNEKFRKINEAYEIGGPSQALTALNRNLDLNIIKYVTFNWKSVADVINILGGIDLEVTRQEYGNGTTTGINGFIQATKETTGIDSTHLKGPGMQHLDGIQAVAYARLRLMDTDFQRTVRQQKVIALAMEKAKQADLGMLIESVDTVFPYILTNFSIPEIIGMMKHITDYHIGATSGFPTKQYPKRMGNKGLCVIPNGLIENVVILHEFLFEHETYLVSESVIRRDQLIRQKASAIDESTARKTTATPTTAATTTTAAADLEKPGKIPPDETMPEESSRPTGPADQITAAPSPPPDGSDEAASTDPGKGTFSLLPPEPGEYQWEIILPETNDWQLESGRSEQSSRREYP